MCVCVCVCVCARARTYTHTQNIVELHPIYEEMYYFSYPMQITRKNSDEEKNNPHMYDRILREISDSAFSDIF
jgi:hypothetical protein